VQLRAGGGRAGDLQVPVERLNPVAQPAEPAAARDVGAADAVVGDVEAQPAVRARTLMVTFEACACLAK
jgi:hypothetical protein